MERQEIVNNREEEIARFELRINVQFPQSYRQFLLEQGSAVIDGYQILGIPEEKEAREERGMLLSFQPGDPKRGGFAWISNYQGRIVGLCNRPDCYFCNLKEREKLENFQGGELRVELTHYQKATREFYIAHLVSVPQQEVKREKPKISVLQATQTLWSLRKDLEKKKLVPICFKKSRLDYKEKALCIDTTRIQEDDAPLVEVSDISQEGEEMTPILFF